MAFILAAAMSRIVTLTCPHCGKKKRAERRSVSYRLCPHCHRRFPDPIAAAKTRTKSKSKRRH